MVARPTGAARLAVRGLDALAAGLLAWVVLPEDPAVAAVEARRVGAAVEVPAVLALAGPRDARFSPILADLDLLAIAAAEDTPRAVAQLAERELAALGPPVAGLAPLEGAARWLARAGIGGGERLPEVVRA